MKKIIAFGIYTLITYFLSSFQIANAHDEESNKRSKHSYFVGELGAQWTLGSDHLPVGGSIGSIHFVMWNILNTDTLHHILRNGQGLRDSFIITANIPWQDNLTLRESMILDQIFEMIEHPTHPRSLLALQETSENVYKKLQQTLSPNLQLLPSSVEELNHGDIFIFDKNLFTLIDFKCAHYKNAKRKQRNTYMALTVQEKETKLLYQFLQSHVPGGPDIYSLPARIEFAQAVIRDHKPEAISVVLGDMNRSPNDFIQQFECAAFKQGLESQPFEIMWPPYATHINTHREASWIDNIFISIPFDCKSLIQPKINSEGSDFFTGLQDSIDLLKSSYLPDQSLSQNETTQ